jgi:hypothetical protein
VLLLTSNVSQGWIKTSLRNFLYLFVVAMSAPAYSKRTHRNYEPLFVDAHLLISSILLDQEIGDICLESKITT